MYRSISLKGNVEHRLLDGLKSYVQAEQGDWAGALESGQASMAAAPTDYFRGFAQLVIARALCHTGQPEQGLQIQVGLIDMLERVRHVLGWIYFSPGLIEDLIAAGARDDAIALLERLEDAAMRGPAPLFAGTKRRRRSSSAWARSWSGLHWPLNPKYSLG